MINICTKFDENILNGLKSYGADTILILIITERHNSVILHMELQFLSSANCLIMVNICTKFCENILAGLRVMEQTQFQY